MYIFEVTTNGLWFEIHCTDRVAPDLGWKNVAFTEEFSNLPTRYATEAEAKRVCEYLRNGNDPWHFTPIES